MILLVDILDDLKKEMGERSSRRGALVAGVAFLDCQIDRLKCMFDGRRIMSEGDICRLISDLKFEKRSLKRRLKKL
jgi:hypothetical protein